MKYKKKVYLKLAFGISYKVAYRKFQKEVQWRSINAVNKVYVIRQPRRWIFEITLCEAPVAQFHIFVRLNEKTHVRGTRHIKLEPDSSLVHNSFVKQFQSAYSRWHNRLRAR